jgi:hypothetical protein
MLAALGATTASAVIKHPTPKQIKRAVARARHSRALWATVNICDTKKYPNTLGVRGQIPALGFKASLSMNIQVEFFDSSKQRFVPVPGATMAIPLGSATTGLQQAGATFSFKPHTGLLSARVEFDWSRAGNVIGRAFHDTTGGHADEDFGSPPHFSAATCRIK